MKKYRDHLKASLITALGYGLGFVLGVVVIRLVLNLGFLRITASYFENQHLVFGLLILFSVVILCGRWRLCWRWWHEAERLAVALLALV